MRRFWFDESGQGLTEYALLIALVSVALAALLIGYKRTLGNVFKNATNSMNSANPITQAS